jgi:hypothetical protein
MRALLVPLVAFATFAACGGGASKSPGTRVSLYKYVGSVQCTGGGTSLPAMERQLTDAGIQVLTSTCGGDGKMYAAVCGAADGRIGIFEVPAAQARAASALGFAPLSNLPAATKVDCQ